MEYLFKLLYFSVKYLAFPSKKKKGVKKNSMSLRTNTGKKKLVLHFKQKKIIVCM